MNRSILSNITEIIRHFAFTHEENREFMSDLCNKLPLSPLRIEIENALRISENLKFNNTDRYLEFKKILMYAFYSAIRNTSKVTTLNVLRSQIRFLETELSSKFYVKDVEILVSVFHEIGFQANIINTTTFIISEKFMNLDLKESKIPSENTLMIEITNEIAEYSNSYS